MTNITTVGTPIKQELIPLKDVSVTIEECNGMYLREAMGEIGAEGGKQLYMSRTMNGMAILVEDHETHRYLIVSLHSVFEEMAYILLGTSSPSQDEEQSDTEQPHGKTEA